MFKTLLAVVSLCIFSPVNAAIVDNGSFITDTATATDYLKFSQTNNNSWLDIVINDSLGLISGGWEVASQSSLLSFATANPDSPYNQLTANGSITLIITNGDLGSGQAGLPSNVSIDFYSNHFTYATNTGSVGVDFEQSNLAIALTRPSAVPIPAAGYLFLTALVGLFVRKRSLQR